MNASAARPRMGLTSRKRPEAPDGTVEAPEYDDSRNGVSRSALAVRWPPERLPEGPDRRLFDDRLERGPPVRGLRHRLGAAGRCAIDFAGMFDIRRGPVPTWHLFLRGMGSLMEIWPPPGRLTELVPEETPAEAFGAYRAEVEACLREAFGQWEVAPQTDEEKGVEVPPADRRESV